MSWSTTEGRRGSVVKHWPAVPLVMGSNPGLMEKRDSYVLGSIPGQSNLVKIGIAMSWVQSRGKAI
eukprot:scaffold3153_cov74-Cyclotella_meneghiniana.AAC.2